MTDELRRLVEEEIWQPALDQDAVRTLAPHDVPEHGVVLWKHERDPLGLCTLKNSVCSGCVEAAAGVARTDAWSHCDHREEVWACIDGVERDVPPERLAG